MKKIIFLFFLFFILTCKTYYAPVPQKPYVIVDFYPYINPDQYNVYKYVFVDVNGNYFEFTLLNKKHEIGDTIN